MGLIVFYFSDLSGPVVNKKYFKIGFPFEIIKKIQRRGDFVRFNKFIWDNYLATEEGKKWINFFSGIRPMYESSSPLLIEFMQHWSAQNISNFTTVNHESVLNLVRRVIEVFEENIRNGDVSSEVHSLSEARSVFEFHTGLGSEEEGFESPYPVAGIPCISIALHALYPNFFFPYFFYPSLDVQKKIFDALGIYCPPVPKKNDRRARFFYYLDLCESLHKFANDVGVELVHIPTLLYGFAPNIVDVSFSIPSDLPAAKRAWFIGGGKNNNGDFDYLDKIASSDVAYWNGSPETELGDIVVMYALSPRSEIHSIWRAVAPGGVEPFFHYYNIIRIGNPLVIPPVGIKQIKSDPVMCEMPLVKGNMQGINGRNIPKRFYDRILSLLKEKGVDISSLPQLLNEEYYAHGVKDERGVEVNILEPLLRRLGYKDSDWERQVTLRVGRSEKVIPDYLIRPVKSEKQVNAKWVWEAKYSSPSNKQVKIDFEQATSYGRLVGADGVSLLSIEGLWIAHKKDDYSFEKVQFWSLSQLQEVDNFNELSKIVGRPAIIGKG